MVANVRAILIALVLSGMSACAPGEVLLTEPPPGYVVDAKARVVAAEWSKAETVTVALSEFRFRPQELDFRTGVPYRLRIENRGQLSHTFDAPEFFAAIAVYKVRSAGSGESRTRRKLSAIRAASTRPRPRSAFIGLSG